MKELFTISEVADLLNIPASTLRFWEEKGVFNIARNDNAYRCYTIHDLPQIAEIVFFRNLGFSISDIIQMKDCGLDETEKHFIALEEQLEDKIQAYEHMAANARDAGNSIQEVRRLMEHPYCREDVPFDSIEAFEFYEKEKLIRYANYPACYVRYIDSHNIEGSDIRGIISTPETNSNEKLWVKNPYTEYITFLIKENADDNYKSDLSQSIERISKEYNTGHLLACYLCTAKENGVTTDYLKAYLEVTP